MKTERHLKKDLANIEIPPLEKVLGITNNRAPRARVSMRFATILVCVILASLLVVGAMAAGTIALIHRLNAPALLGYTHLTDVPEGWVGIYTVADLAAIGNSDNSSYILMNDIELTDADYAEGGICEGGWIPVKADYFNGNGYIIRNLKINSSAFTDELAHDISYTGFLSTANSVRHLGIENCEINVSADCVINAGAIVGSAYTVYGCYSSNVKINITIDSLNTTSAELYDSYIGGVSGKANYLDSCWSDADISVTNQSQTADVANVAGLSGSSFSVVTSYFTGNISVSGFENYNTGMYTLNDFAAGMPVLLSESSMNLILDKLNEKYPENDPDASSIWQQANFYTKKVIAYYSKKSVDYAVSTEDRKKVETMLTTVLTDNSFTFDAPDINATWYFLDMFANPQEISIIAEIVAEAFGGYDAFIDFCAEQNIKCGLMYCYGKGETVYEGFDFVNIWKMTDGKPTLKAFD